MEEEILGVGVEREPEKVRKPTAFLAELMLSIIFLISYSQN